MTARRAEMEGYLVLSEVAEHFRMKQSSLYNAIARCQKEFEGVEFFIKPAGKRLFSETHVKRLRDALCQLDTSKESSPSTPQASGGTRSTGLPVSPRTAGNKRSRYPSGANARLLELRDSLCKQSEMRQKTRRRQGPSPKPQTSTRTRGTQTGAPGSGSKD